MNIDFENTGTQIVFQTVRGLLTLAGMSGICCFYRGWNRDFL